MPERYLDTFSAFEALSAFELAFPSIRSATGLSEGQEYIECGLLLEDHRDGPASSQCDVLLVYRDAQSPSESQEKTHCGFLPEDHGKEVAVGHSP